MQKINSVAIVGATSAVGSEIIKILDERSFPVREIIPLSSGKSGAEHLEIQGESVTVRPIKESSFQGVDLAFFAAGSTVSREYAPRAVAQGCTVIDTSSCFRLDAGVPLVVPEINASSIQGHRGIIASPSDIITQMAMVLYPLHRKAKIKRVITSTYQSVSSSGQPAVTELSEQIQALFNFREPEVQIFPSQIAFNCLPHVGAFLDDGYSEEECAIVRETQKIFGDDSIQITATAVRVPVFYGHAQTLHIETDKKLSPKEARTILSKTPGIIIEDEPQKNLYPLPLFTIGKDEICVGRIRKDHTIDNGLALWIVGDNLRKGSALNAVQIAEHIFPVH